MLAGRVLLHMKHGALICWLRQAVLPILFLELVDRRCSGSGAAGEAEQPCGLMSADEFYAGLAAAEAMPGPLSNVAAYLGAHSCCTIYPREWHDSATFVV
jgi:hypothetical protein